MNNNPEEVGTLGHLLVTVHWSNRNFTHAKDQVIAVTSGEFITVNPLIPKVA